MARVVPLESLQQFAAINLLSDPGYDRGNRTIPNCAEVRLDWSLTDGKTGHNVLHCQYSGTPPFTAAVAEAIRAAITTGAGWTALAAHLAPTTSLRSVTLTDIRSNVGLSVISTGAATPGTSTGSALPDEVALVTRIQTNTRGPSGRGRIYQPGLATTALSAGNVVLPALVTALGNWIAVTVQGAVSANVGPIVLGRHSRIAYVSPITGRSFPARPADTLPVAGFNVDNHWDSQRRRGLK